MALAAGAGVIAATGTFAPGLDQVPLLAEPRLHVPEFSWTAMVELVVPLAITVLVVQNGQGIAVLTAAGHAPADQRHRGRLRRGLASPAPSSAASRPA